MPAAKPKSRFLHAKVGLWAAENGFLRAKNHFAKLKNALLRAKIDFLVDKCRAAGQRGEKNGFGGGGEAVCLEKTVYLRANPPCRKPNGAGAGDFGQK